MGGYKHKTVGNTLSKSEWESTDSHKIRQGTSFPSSPSDGDEFYRTDEHVLYVYDSDSPEWKAQGGKEVNTEQILIADLVSRPSETEMSQGIYAVDGQIYIRTGVK